MELRPQKFTDQDIIEKGFNLVRKLMAEHPEIEPTLWAGVMWSILVDGYIACGFRYEDFAEEWDRVKIHYKNWFEE